MTDLEPQGLDRVLPPGQSLAAGWPVMHYGPVPRGELADWELSITGDTHDGADFVLTAAEFAALPQVEVVGDLHCVTRWTVPQNRWRGVLMRTILELCPPATSADHALAWAEYGYSTNIRVSDLSSARAIVATHHNGEPLAPERGAPVRLVLPHLYGYKGPKWFRGIEYLAEPGRGFWEQRGYHAVGDPWRQERWSYQE